MDEVSMLTAITLFLLSASNELVGVTVLQKGCMDLFQNGLNSSDSSVSICIKKEFAVSLHKCTVHLQLWATLVIDFIALPQVQARCYQLLLSVFQHFNRALSTPYIHTLAPLIVEKLKAVEHNRPRTAAELQAVQEGIRVLENLVGMGEEQCRKYAFVWGINNAQ